jgi:hypothetical protein
MLAKILFQIYYAPVKYKDGFSWSINVVLADYETGGKD